MPTFIYVNWCPPLTAYVRYAKVYSMLGWISPEGELFQCEVCGHIDCAKDICIQHGITVPRYGPDFVLYQLGWIYVSWENVTSRIEPTQNQLNKLFDIYMMLNGTNGKIALYMKHHGVTLEIPR